MSDEDKGQDKTEEPTDKRRKDFREKGRVAQSRDLASTGVLLAVGLAMFAWTPAIISACEDLARQFLGVAPANSDLFLADPYGLMKLGLKNTLWMSGPIVLAGMIAGLLLAIAQVGLVWSWKPLEPDPNKLNPINGLKQKLFSMQAVFEWLKAMAKVTVIAAVGYKIAQAYAGGLVELASSSLRDSVGWTAGVIIRLMLFCLLAMLFLGIADYMFAKWQLLKKMRMTLQEVKEENKESEGDPYMKARVRRIMSEMSRNRLMAEVSEATVVVVNPTHYAVAIKYEMGQDGPPMVVARGVDARAKLIKDIARSNGVPRIENRPLARGLYADCKEGEYVPANLYEAVAEVLAFVYKLRERRAG
ncbi:MAG: flagellar biosynthesis protein FlhB [Proteobacteria bacterium]|nr:flagellar biosynthesis protein FlhB [Pseudomonadota bacterium]